MKKLLIILVCFSLFGAAQAQKVNKKTPLKEVIAIYEDCTVYAGSTDYSFQDIKTKTSFSVRILNIREKGIFSPKIPKNLIDPSKDLEGVPGANPAVVGKRFKLAYTAQDELISITPTK